MPIGGENVGISVEVVIEKEETEGEAQQTGASDRRARRFVHKKPIAFIVIKPNHLVREVAHNEMLSAGAIVIGNIDAHSSARHAIFPKGNPSGEPFLFKCAVLQVAIELVRLGIVGDE